MKLWIIVLGIVAALMLLSAGYYRFTQEEVTVNVTKTESVTSGSGQDISSKYLVFAEEETFENTDCLWAGKFRSSDLHGALGRPGNYTLLVYGWRIPFLSQYRNIIRIKSFNADENGDTGVSWGQG